MKKSKNRWKKVLIIIGVVVIVIVGGGYLFLEYLESELKSMIKGAKLETTNFQTVIPFEYVNNWIVVKAKVGESDKEYPFIFDTGAQTVLMDSLLNEIDKSSYTKFGFSNQTDTAKHAFNSGIITLKSLKLGDVKFSDIGAISAKNSKWGMLNCISAYGIIGYNVLQTGIFVIDYEKREITITDNEENLSGLGEIEWISYTPSSKQETPIIPAVINDSIEIDLFFDTGMSGGIKLASSTLYQTFNRKFPEQTVSYSSKPALLIRGGK